MDAKRFEMKVPPFKDGVKYGGGVDWGAPVGTPIPVKSEGKVMRNDSRKGWGKLK